MEDAGRQMRSMRRRGMSNRQIAEATGMTVEQVAKAMAVGRPPESVQPDPNELLIQLTASAIRLSWEPGERRSRHYMAEWRISYRDPVSLMPPAFSPN